jgi:hypothetical protein
VGTGDLGNTDHGVDVHGGASDNTIGGTAAGAGNTIAYNGGSGVLVQSGTGNGVLSNSIYDNAAQGLALGTSNVTANDDGDADGGANDLQNYPVLTAVYRGSTTIEGTLNSVAGTAFRLEFFSNASCAASGYGEGEALVATRDVTTDGSGDASFSVTLSQTLDAGAAVTATATDPGNNTSEFSACASVADFALETAEDAVAVAWGESAAFEVEVSAVSGTFGGQIGLACSGLPAGATCTFTPATVSPGAATATSDLSVATTNPDTPLGDALFTITATSGALSASKQVTLTVSDFDVGLSPSTVTVTGGQSTSIMVAVDPEGGEFPDDVTLACSGLATGTSCSFSPGTVSPGDNGATSTLTLSTTALAADVVRWPWVPTTTLPGGLVLVLAFLVLAAAVARRSGPRQKLAMATVVVSMALVSGCSDTTEPSPTPNPVTFTLTVTGTSGALTHSATTSVTVR